VSALQAAQSYAFNGAGRKLVLLLIALLVSLLGWFAGYLATLEISPFRMAVIVTAIASVPIIVVHTALLSPIFLGLLWARVSDVAVATHGVPSIATPVAAALLAWSLFRKIRSGEGISLKTFGDLGLALPYVAVVTLSPLWSAVPARAFDASAILLKDIVIYWMFADALRDRNVLLRAAEIVIIAAAVLSVTSLHQYFADNFEFTYGGFAQSAILNIVGDVDSYRLGGPVNSPNYFALILVITVPIGIALLRTSLAAVERGLIALLLAPIGLTVLLTFSRGGSILLALLVLLSFRRTRFGVPQLILAAIAIGAVLMVTPPRVWDRLGTLAAPIIGSAETNTIVDESVELRIGAQATAIEMFLSHPFLGVGAGNFPPLYQEYSRWLGLRTRSAEYTPHNLYLETLAETGVIGLVAFLITFMVPLVTLWRARRAWPVETRAGRDHLELSYGLEIALFGWLVAGIFEQGAYPRYYWLLLAMVIGAAHVTDFARRQVESPSRRSTSPRPLAAPA
jgi:O-antigen ligase